MKNFNINNRELSRTGMVFAFSLAVIPVGILATIAVIVSCAAAGTLAYKLNLVKEEQEK